MSIDQLRRACELLEVEPSKVVQDADRAALTLSRQGVSILTTPEETTDKALAFLGGAALAALLVSIFSKR